MYRNPDLSNKIFDCLLTARGNVQSVDRMASFLFVGDVNAHHEILFINGRLIMTESKFPDSLYTYLQRCLPLCTQDFIAIYVTEMIKSRLIRDVLSPNLIRGLGLLRRICTAGLRVTLPHDRVVSR